MGISAAATYILYISPGDVEPNQLNDAQRAWVDGQHTEGIASIQHDRACHCRLEDDAPGDTELGAEVGGAGGKDNAAEGGVGECAGQAGAGAHRGLQLTAVAAGHKGRRGDAAHDQPRAHDGCGVRELATMLLPDREGSPKLHRRRSRQRAESAVVGRGRDRRRRHDGRDGDHPVQQSSCHQSQATSASAREVCSHSEQWPPAPQQLVLSGCRLQRESTSEREMGQHLGRGVRAWRGTLSSDKRLRHMSLPRLGRVRRRSAEVALVSARMRGP